MRDIFIGLDETICSICGHKRHGYLSCSWIGPVLHKVKEFQPHQRNPWNQAAPTTTPLPVVKTMEEREICNNRISSNTPWNTIASASPALQARPSNYTTGSITTRSVNRPKEWDIAKATSINTNLPYNRWQCAFCKKFAHNIKTCTKKLKTLHDLNNRIQPSLNNIFDRGRVRTGWDDWDKDFYIAEWIHKG